MEKIRTFCPHEGINVPIDEDGCCVCCGADAYGKGVDELNKRFAELNAALEVLARLVMRRYEYGHIHMCCPTDSLGERCKNRAYKKDHECMACTVGYAITRARKNLRRRKK